jgi:hypothetical protein
LEREGEDRESCARGKLLDNSEDEEEESPPLDGGVVGMMKRERGRMCERERIGEGENEIYKDRCYYE